MTALENSGCRALRALQERFAKFGNRLLVRSLTITPTPIIIIIIISPIKCPATHQNSLNPSNDLHNQNVLKIQFISPTPHQIRQQRSTFITPNNNTKKNPHQTVTSITNPKKTQNPSNKRKIPTRRAQIHPAKTSYEPPTPSQQHRPKKKEKKKKTQRMRTRANSADLSCPPPEGRPTLHLASGPESAEQYKKALHGAPVPLLATRLRPASA
ncbi:hypothetical protein M758_1G167600, partial [Ceratodon purpureus]